jgi:hypothetical protein
VPRYPKMKILHEPEGLVVGAEVGVVGDGHETYKIWQIDRDEDGQLDHVYLDSGWREPLCKIYVLDGRSHQAAWNDPTSWIGVAIGECDICGKTFPDSCAYHADENDRNVMICQDCFKKGNADA